MTYISLVTAIFFRSVIKVVLRFVWTCKRESGVDSLDQRDDGNHKVEEGGATYQSHRPVPVRRPPDRYGEWVLSSIQEIVAHLQTLEAKQNMEKERIRKLKPKLLKKAKALRNI